MESDYKELIVKAKYYVTGRPLMWVINLKENQITDTESFRNSFVKEEKNDVVYKVIGIEKHMNNDNFIGLQLKEEYKLM